MSPRSPVEFTDIQHNRVGNQISIANIVDGIIPSLPVKFGDSPSVDAFSRARVSEPAYLFSVYHQYGLADLIMESGATGTGVTPTWSSDTRMVALSCTAGSGTSYHQSYEYIPYQPLKSQEIAITGVIGAAVDGAVVDVGLFDAANGLFFRQNGTSGLQWVRRSSTSGGVVNETVNQTNWSLDTLDGNGPSGITLDITKSFILIIDAQYLGMGRVRVGFDISGQIVYCHEFLHANVISVPYMQSLTLPIQILITATATASTKTCYMKCASVVSEGGFSDGISYSFATPPVTVTAGNGAATHLVSLRPRTTFGGITNRQSYHWSHVDLLVTGNSPIFWQLSTGATFSAGPTWANVDTNLTGAEYTSGAGTLSAIGNIFACGFVPASNQVKGQEQSSISVRRPITLNRAGAQRASGTLSLCVTGIGGASAVYGSVSYREIR